MKGCSLPIIQQFQRLKGLRWDEFAFEGYTGLNAILNNELYYRYEYLIWAEKLLEGLVGAFNLPVPYIYPMEDSDRISVEWDIMRGSVTLELDMEKRIAHVLVIELEACDTEYVSYLNYPGEESLLGRFLADEILGDVK